MSEANPPSEAVVGLYRRHARAWAERRGRSSGQPIMEAAWLGRFLQLMPAGPRVLDVGCGSGEPIADFLVGQQCRVTGIDAAPELIALCRARRPDQAWHVGDMRAMALGASFDGIIAWNSLFHLSHADQRRMVPILRAHAAPGAALMFTSGPSHGEAIGRFGGEPLYHASLDGDEYRALLDRNGFDVLAHAVEDPACGGHTIWLARRR
ncbi:class I SAM-dependent methyltransferase [Methylobacterium sp. JK268]